VTAEEMHPLEAFIRARLADELLPERPTRAMLAVLDALSWPSLLLSLDCPHTRIFRALGRIWEDHPDYREEWA
jgi:hypothetical protein